MVRVLLASVGSPSSTIFPNTVCSPTTASVTSITVALAKYQLNAPLPPETETCPAVAKVPLSPQ